VLDLPTHADVIVVGGGHNGLACAAYLARAGRSVVLLEARASMGGCASTVDAIGARVNICNCDHTMVLASGIVDDLDLAAHGLRYLDVDPVSVAVGWDEGAPPFVQWRSMERTIDGLRRTDPAAAAAYQRYLDAALPVARLMLEVQRGRPTMTAIAAAAGRRKLRGSTTLLRWARSTVLDVMGGFGLPDWMIAAVATSGPAVWGLPPDAAGTGLAALGPAVRHLVGVGRPVGGSGSLPAALAACAEAHGAALVTGVAVDGLLVEHGTVRGVRTAAGTVRAGSVVAAIDPNVVMRDWLADVGPVSALRAAYARAAPGEGYESKLDAVVGAVPVPRALLDLPEDVLPVGSRGVATTLFCPTPAQQIAAVAARRAGRVSDPPMFLVNVPSVLDATMRPSPDTHLLSLEVLWTPYALAGGWAGSAEPYGWLERLAGQCPPGLLDSVRDWRVVTPADYERDFGLARGYAPSYPGSVLATLFGRRRELSRYRLPVDGLYLTGAGTFPGAGVWGASGRNAAATVLAA
jgi:phytoene dehydrogenase-like protein